MGSIPVAGAKKTESYDSFFSAPTRTTHLCEQKRAKWVRIFGAERVKLACKRQAERYSPQAKFPFFESYDSVFLAPTRRTHLCEQKRAKWVRIFGAERVKLACKRQAERYSPQAKFPFFENN